MRQRWNIRLEDRPVAGEAPLTADNLRRMLHLEAGVVIEAIERVPPNGDAGGTAARDELQFIKSNERPCTAERERSEREERGASNAAPPKSIDALIDASSLGSPEARAARASVPQKVVDRVLRRADELDAAASPSPWSSLSDAERIRQAQRFVAERASRADYEDAPEAKETAAVANLIAAARAVRKALVPAVSTPEWPHHRLSDSFVRQLCEALDGLDTKRECGATYAADGRVNTCTAPAGHGGWEHYERCRGGEIVASWQATSGRVRPSGSEATAKSEALVSGAAEMHYACVACMTPIIATGMCAQCDRAWGLGREEGRRERNESSCKFAVEDVLVALRDLWAAVEEDVGSERHLDPLKSALEHADRLLQQSGSSCVTCGGKRRLRVDGLFWPCSTCRGSGRRLTKGDC